MQVECGDPRVQEPMERSNSAWRIAGQRSECREVVVIVKSPKNRMITGTKRYVQLNQLRFSMKALKRMWLATHIA